jgi:adiponectin receptor
MEDSKSDKHSEGQTSEEDSEIIANPYLTDDEDDTIFPGNNSNNQCYKRKSRVTSKQRISKKTKNGHSRTKSEGSALFQTYAQSVFADDSYGNGNITDNLTNVEMLSNCQLSRRRVQSTSRNRDLSPTEAVRHYITQEKEQMDIMIGRIVHNVEDMAEVVAQKSSEVAKHIVHNVHEKAEAAAQKSSEIVHSAIEKSSHIADVAAQKSSKIVHSAIEKSSQIADKFWKVCHFEKLSAWQKDNEHLLYGHRPELASAAECFKSIFRIHTETGNIWTHMIGFFAFVVVTIIFYVKPLCDNCHAEALLEDKLVFLCFFVGAMLCLLCSTLFHTMSCHSEFVSNVFSRLDYAGIALLICGSSITWLYFGFYCEFYYKLTYIISIAVLGILTIVITMMEKFNRPEYRTFRASLFVGLGITSALPIIHLIKDNGLAYVVERGALYHALIMGALYITGACLYAARIPERFMPGKCDIWFQSHQIFHILVVAAAFVFYDGMSDMAKYRLVHDPFCPEPISAE